MPTCGQSVNRGLRHVPFDGNAVVVVEYSKARRVARRLRVQPLVDNTGDHLHMTLGLHRSAHEPKTHQWLAVARQKTGDDGVKWAPSRRHLVRMARTQIEAPAPILQGDAGIGHDHARTKALEVR